MAIEDDILAAVEETNTLLRQTGYRKERVTNEDIQKQNNTILVELRDIKKLIRGGVNNATGN